MHTDQPLITGNLHILKPRKALNKAYLKVKPNRSQIESFKQNLIELLDRTNEIESEEFHKNLVTDFLKRTYYHPSHFINTKGRTDLVIHNGDKAKSSVGVIIEAKKPTNRAEMLSRDKINCKAFHELVLYYLRERITHKNLEIKYLVATNINEWFIFDANFFEKAFAQNKKLVSQFTDFEAGRLAGKTTDFFYKEIAEPFVAEMQQEVEFTHFDIRNYEKPLRNNNPKDDNKLIALFKLLSPEHLLKLPFSNDSNSLDKRFYGELLHIIGLTENKQGGKKIIERQKEGQRNTGSFLENAIIQLESMDKIGRLDNPAHFGETQEDRLFSVGLELSITWLNRILFLKLLEAQLLTYHKGDRSYEFLSLDRIHNYDDLNSLFFQVLARQHGDRNEDVKALFEKVPYLNSSLFEPTDIEHATLFISNLRDDKTLPIYSSTVLKDKKGKKRSGELNALEYLFEFLNAYDFSSEGGETIQEDNKTLINASVLGLIFEKINGYKDGSFFTPGFITMYMCRETIRKAVVQKFNEAKGWNCEDLDTLYDRIEDRQEANELINSLKICDPAVGSGHFLVSALNEMIAIKNDLNILQDRHGRRLKEYHVEVVNDELIVTDDDGELFEYNPSGKESQRVQEALFHEKQNIIENCLFGVDINPNSVKICRLRLWIELLKHAYYKNETELETLPNIDINIKCGNSLISRFDLDADLSKALKDSKWNIDSYRVAVDTYRNAHNKEQKREMEKIIHDIKNDFRSEISTNDPKVKRLEKVKGEIFLMANQTQLFEQSKREKAAWNKRLEKLTKESKKLEIEIQEIKDNKVFEDAFEWRFEFPEVLDDNGDYAGFDVVIGNPPYFSLSKIKEQSDYFSQAGFTTFSKGADIYCLFYERGGEILKPQGHLTYITSNSWLRGIYGNLLKDYFLENLHPIALLNIEDIQVFDEATVESNIITLQKGKKTSSFPVVNLSEKYAIGSSLAEFFNNYSFDFVIPETSDWFIGNQKETELKLKIETNSKPLKEFDLTINFGIKTGYNKAFIIEEEKKDELIKEHPESANIIKPILRGRDVQKYKHDFSRKWAICTFPALKIDIDDYPAVRDYLLSLGKFRLEQCGKKGSRKKTSNKWFETQDSISYWKDFNKPKIIWGEISDRPKFAFDDSGYYAEATTFLMTGEKLKFLLAILNSKVSEWYFNLIGTTTGMGTNRWKKYKIELLPVKVPTVEQENKIESLVDQILESKKENSAADTFSLEAEIDKLVYELYDLTEVEIDIIENN
ncbi:Type II restriction/modification system, DNA methylase subunit YeeA [Salinimicrobium catena]|uniref:site-specific DNA-methyltransferase (adenine-specific) n=1 Tax=Salinimicrobium catena TaxID=390640 RepID=A0A1H5MT47_9FLAO|nr:TaqI-like C-terminal specificity domain-containing protein [Salinimicrobium catena]SDL28220.1 Type II restriction/modification system, DNA methylase subunit YeeA [Salinimicrobium catena]SEE91927.1 Type II restriction/modification system, DNA methylase subunit YeeA [Salinimicrobium catena]